MLSYVPKIVTLQRNSQSRNFNYEANKETEISTTVADPWCQQRLFNKSENKGKK